MTDDVEKEYIKVGQGEKSSARDQHINLIPMDNIDGFDVRPGFYEINGATPIPGGVNFTIHSNQATYCELLLFNRRETEPFAVLPFPKHYKIGNCYSMIVFGVSIDFLEYAYRMDGPYDPKKGQLFNRNNILLDPYAKAVAGLREFGVDEVDYSGYRARVVKDDFDWGDCMQPLTPMEDLIIYELHVRGFTMDKSSGVKWPGTFDGIREKVPYLKELGVTAVELMPIFEFDEMHDYREYNGHALIDYWGYNTVSYFSPNTAYCSQPEYNKEGNELKRVIKMLNECGIEVYLDVVFNHTAEGNEQGPIFSFKGIDNNIYYMLTPEGYYYNFSGCGNTLNCNHPIVRQMIIDCLRYWVIAYRIDGFRFDLASILGRAEDGSPMSSPPLLESLAFDPILGNVKLIAEAWDAGGMYQVGTFPSWNRWVEWNGKYRDDIRSFLKGDDFKSQVAANRISGSPDIYNPEDRGCYASVNFITCHDGFTLHDLYTYNHKHNESNGWNNTDGANDNYSWNCGYEGETDIKEINDLRERLVKNACVVLMLSRGIPMFLAGDEFGNTQFGNNNAYCHDDITSWLDWTLLEKNRKLFSFFQYMIWFRKNHGIVRKDTEKCSLGYPFISHHGLQPFNPDYNANRHYVGILYAGRNHKGEDELVYMAINAFWEPQTITLPKAPEGRRFYMVIDTYREESVVQDIVPVDGSFTLMPRSVVVFETYPYIVTESVR
ncbi:MAG: glycogen debranching protein GlgX [Lachnospiraceae bacterium]|nr:glycogen debranching protein GlgX [Lachnospiraceae bacterium]